MALPPRQRPPSDPISVASARLFAVLVDRRQRLVALRFLGILMGQADANGRVHVDPDDLVGLGMLNGLGPDEVDRSRRVLELVGVLDREAGAWRIQGFTPADVGALPADAMAAIARVLDSPVPAANWTKVDTEPAVVRASRRSAWRLAAVGGAVAVAAGVALLLAGPPQLRLPTQTSRNAGAERTRTVAGATSTSSQATTTAGLSSTPSTSLSPGSSSAPASVAPTTCPQGRVLAAVDSVVQEPNPPPPPSTTTPPTSVPTGVTANVPGVVRTTVYGTLENTSLAAVVVDPFPVDVVVAGPSDVGSSTTTGTALSAPVTVAPGAKIPWQVSVDAPPQGAGSMTAKAKLGTWRWADPALATACKR